MWNGNGHLILLHKLLLNFNTSKILEKNDLKLTFFVVIDETHDLYLCTCNNRMHILTYCIISWTVFEHV